MQAVGGGAKIVATKVLTPGSCGIVEDSFTRNERGTLLFESSGTEHDYDDQEQATRDGKPVFLDEYGREWTEDEIELVPNKAELVAMVQESDLDEMVHDVASLLGSAANNDGPAGQIDFLISQGVSLAEIYERIKAERPVHVPAPAPEPPVPHCPFCGGKKYVIAEIDGGPQEAVQRCDNCTDPMVFTDEDAAKLAEADGIKCLLEYPCLLTEPRASSPEVEIPF